SVDYFSTPESVDPFLCAEEHAGVHSLPVWEKVASHHVTSWIHRYPSTERDPRICHYSRFFYP
ncbi:hypothetical protein JRY13_06100, partial [Lacticaseibacillus paracasei]